MLLTTLLHLLLLSVSSVILGAGPDLSYLSGIWGPSHLTENIDTTTSGGKLIFHIFGALAEFERNLIRERTQAGLVAARERGRIGGRPKALTPRQIRIAQSLYDDPNNSIAEICRTLKISKATLYRAIKTGEDAGHP
jgi:DNA invertase Pin-like site-specific DNA recombinase